MTTDGDKRPEISPKMRLWAADQHEYKTGHNVVRFLVPTGWTCHGLPGEDCDVNSDNYFTRKTTE